MCSNLNVGSFLISAILAVLFIATASDEFLSVQLQWKQILKALIDGASYFRAAHERQSHCSLPDKGTGIA